MNRLLCVFAAAVLILSFCDAETKRNKRFIYSEGVIDIDPDDLSLTFEGSGNGGSVAFPDDEDLYDGSGDYSGSGGSEIHPEILTTPVPTPVPTRLSKCEKERRRSNNSLPRCTDTGEYEKMQCQGDPGRNDCWCVGQTGVIIPGTNMRAPSTPDCTHGSNLPTCAYLMLRNSHGLLGTYTPKCTFDGHFETIQCDEGSCWCVDKSGAEIVGTRKYSRERPMCDLKSSTTTAITTEVFIVDQEDTDLGIPIDKDKGTSINGYDINTEATEKDEKTNKPDNIDVRLPDDPWEEGEDDAKNNEVNKESQHGPTMAENYFAKPFIMGAVIAGAVVGLLGAILLVMFIVYRLRKKDEGSYPLEEQKFTNYSYMKAPDKEFYA